MFQIEKTKIFKRDAKKYIAKDGDREKLRKALKLLASGEKLPTKFRDHQLKGKLRHFRELHIESDWLLVYQKDNDRIIVRCIWLVSHAKLKEQERSI